VIVDPADYGRVLAALAAGDDDRRRAETDGIETAASLSDAVDLLLGLTDSDSET